jgi:hypothetical protein
MLNNYKKDKFKLKSIFKKTHVLGVDYLLSLSKNILLALKSTAKVIPTQGLCTCCSSALCHTITWGLLQIIWVSTQVIVPWKSFPWLWHAVLGLLCYGAHFFAYINYTEAEVLFILYIPISPIPRKHLSIVSRQYILKKWVSVSATKKCVSYENH